MPSLVRRLLRFAVFLSVLTVLGLGALIFAATSGMGRGQIESLAQRALSQFAGDAMTARFGGASLVFDGINLVGLELLDVRLGDGSGDTRMATAGRLRFGVALIPLLQGRIELTGARLANARIIPVPTASAAATTVTKGVTGLLAPLRNARGLVEPDRVARELLVQAGRVYSVFTDRPGAEIRVSGLVIDPDPDGLGDEVIIEEAVIAKQQGRIAIEAEGTARTFHFTASGAIQRDAAAGISLDATIDVPRLHVDFGPDQLGRERGEFTSGARFAIAARQSGDGRAHADLDLLLDNAFLSTREGDLEEGRYRLQARLEEGTGKVEFIGLQAEVGRNHLHFHGAFAPAPESVHPDPVYRYELVSDGSRLAPADSPEPTLTVLARIAGIVDPRDGRVTADELGVRTTHGALMGKGALVFSGGTSPAAFLAISATDIPVSHAKQLWPWISAHGARRWALDNVFGGTLRSSQVTLSTRPGQLGSGIPLGPEEVSGRFEIENARFNLTGEIPPVRDASGTVEFAGRSVRIGLSSGTVYMHSGRSVEGRNGTLAIDVIRGEPLMGTLEIDIAGDADAVTELAAYKPIDALRFLDLKPADFSGRVTGHVSGMIPLQREVDSALIDWDVQLDYEALDIARSFDGQFLTEAVGSIHVDRTRARIEARGRLNGVPAELSLIEPLDRDRESRRDIRIELDDKARARLMPGLETIITGPVSVSVTQDADGARRVDADLSRAVLHFPWVGWRKGSGVAASMRFTMRERNGSTELEDFLVEGEGFAIEGKARLAEGRLAEGNFHRVRLNRDDRFSLVLARQGEGYRLNLSGKRIDVRSLVKQALSGSGTQRAGSGDATPIWLQAKSEIVTGFGGEELRAVTLDYHGAGDAISALTLNATTRHGLPFSASVQETQGRRGVRMQSADAGSILRFLDIYPHMAGGTIDLQLSGGVGGPLVGQIDARNFELVNEPRLRSLVASAPAGSPSLDEATQGRIQTTRASFEHGFARIEKGDEYLSISDGVLRGTEIGSTFQGMLYDADGRIAITGTFMPAYGLNRIFAEIPFFGIFLGNGRDRGLIGITYKLSGDAKSPQLTINPISAIAPGVFRNIFQFH